MITLLFGHLLGVRVGLIASAGRTVGGHHNFTKPYDLSAFHEKNGRCMLDQEFNIKDLHNSSQNICHSTTCIPMRKIWIVSP